jgi:hypothetical protein
MPGQASFRIGEGDDENQPFLRHDFAEDELAPHVLAVGAPEAIVECAARPEIELHRHDVEPCRPPPFAEMFGLGPGLPHPPSRRGVGALDDELKLLFGGVWFDVDVVHVGYSCWRVQFCPA